jgi:integrase
MEAERKPRRPHGSGSVFMHRGSWYGRWYVGSHRVKRRLGRARQPGEREGLTKSQAERELRARMQRESVVIPSHDRLTVAEAGRRVIDRLEGLGRKPSTIRAYRGALDAHLAPHFGAMRLDRIHPDDVEGFIAAERRRGVAVKTTLNALGLLHSIFEQGIRRGWASSNPCKHVDKPVRERSGEIRFLDSAELDALLQAPVDERFRPTDRTLYLTAAMTGLRQGELLALRWRDVDWTAARIRVRRNYVRGVWGTPKTQRSTRAVPLADRVAAELERHFQRSSFQGDDDLVFAHPERGTVLDHSDLGRRFKRALAAAGVRRVRFHDLRHTFGTRMAAAGVPLRTLQEWMGHRDFNTTLV